MRRSICCSRVFARVAVTGRPGMLCCLDSDGRRLTRGQPLTVGFAGCCPRTAFELSRPAFAGDDRLHGHPAVMKPVYRLPDASTVSSIYLQARSYKPRDGRRAPPPTRLEPPSGEQHRLRARSNLFPPLFWPTSADTPPFVSVRDAFWLCPSHLIRSLPCLDSNVGSPNQGSFLQRLSLLRNVLSLPAYRSSTSLPSACSWCSQGCVCIGSSDDSVFRCTDSLPAGLLMAFRFQLPVHHRLGNHCTLVEHSRQRRCIRLCSDLALQRCLDGVRYLAWGTLAILP